ncbi:hypothetical protein M422DRAFT_31995, partial [Sphaerobolus stellatus SS14]
MESKLHFHDRTQSFRIITHPSTTPINPLDLPLSLMFTVASREYLTNPQVSPSVHPQSPRIPQNHY